MCIKKLIERYRWQCLARTRLPHDSATLDGLGEHETPPDFLGGRKELTFDIHGRRISFCGVFLNIADLKITVGCCSFVCKTLQFASKSGNMRRVVTCLEVMEDSFSTFLLFVTCCVCIYVCLSIFSIYSVLSFK